MPSQPPECPDPTPRLRPGPPALRAWRARRGCGVCRADPGCRACRAVHPRRGWAGRTGALLALALGTAWLGGCGHAPADRPAAVAPAAAAAADLLVAPPALRVEGLPPVPRSLARAVERYSEGAGHLLTDWDATTPRLLVRHRAGGGSVLQLHRVDGPGARPLALTRGREPVDAAMVQPGPGGVTVISQSVGGNEAHQVFRLDADGSVHPLADPEARNSAQAWLRRSGELLGISVPLDRTAEGGRREVLQSTLWRVDPRQSGSRTAIAHLPGTGWWVGAVTPDDAELVLVRYRSVGEQELWRLPLKPQAAAPERLLPAPGQPPGVHRPIGFTPDGRSLLLLADGGSDRQQPMRLDWSSRRLQALGAPIESAELEAAELSADGRVLALQVNADGHGSLLLRDAASGAPLPLPPLPEGSVQKLKAHPALPLLAFMVSGARGPGQIHVLDLDKGRIERWTEPVLDTRLDREALTGQQVVHWSSFDGLRISGLITRPPPRFGGRRPVLIQIHGGPESQAREGFLGRWHYLPQEMGVAIVQPNVRGSTGRGRAFHLADNGRLREDAVRDIGALLDWIATQPDLDPARVVVAGGSYGGYMSLAVAATWPERIAGAISHVGISHFVTFLENTESYRRDLRRAEYGDERDPQTRAFLHRISPLTQAHRIRKPLLVMQGRNDPRVPMGEAEQIVRQVRANGTPVGYVLADNEGHGFKRKENVDHAFLLELMFLQQLIGPAAAGAAR